MTVGRKKSKQNSVLYDAVHVSGTKKPDIPNYLKKISNQQSNTLLQR